MFKCFKEMLNLLVKTEEIIPSIEEIAKSLPTSDLTFYQKELEATRQDIKYYQKQIQDNKAEALFWRQKYFELMSKKEDK